MLPKENTMKTKFLHIVILSFCIGNIYGSPTKGTCGDKLSWEYDKTSQTLTILGSGAMTNYKNFQSVPWKAFGQDIKFLKIKNGVTEIGAYAFSDCTNLIEVDFPNSLLRIGSNSFLDCKNLSSITIPYSVHIIEYSAFCYCSKLKDVSISNPTIEIGRFAFRFCENLSNVVLPGEPSDKTPWIAFPDKAHVKYLFNKPNTANYHNDKPAFLSLVPQTLNFAEPSGNNAIDGNELCYIKFKIKNEGGGVARNCIARVQMTGSVEGISTSSNKVLDPIMPNETKEISIPIQSDLNVKDGTIKFLVNVDEPNGFGIDPIELNMQTRAYESPLIQIVDYAVTGTTGGTLMKKKPFNLQLLLQNTKYGKAQDVNVEIELPDNVFIIEGNKRLFFPLLNGGEIKSLEYELVVNNNYTSSIIPIHVKMREKEGKFSEDRTIELQLNQSLASTNINLEAIEKEQHNEAIQLATIGSAVDKNIPVSRQQSSTTFAVIIANENYQQVAKVPFALNDGNIFAQYCEKTLGIPSQNIHLVTDATINNIRQQVNWLSQVIKAYNGNAKVIFYYAGHGVPDEKSKTAFLLPVDGNGSDITTGYKLDDLYSTLGSLPSQSITIFLDACFSGSKREDGMLASARGVAIKVNKGQPTGNMVVFSAATGDETAYPNNQEGHGMFTYYLLKKLQDTKGDVTYEDLANYIKQNVAQQSIVLNGKSQTPTVTASPAVTDWQSWKLK